jgi:hypothetical protein
MELDPPVKRPDSSYDIPIKAAETLFLKYSLHAVKETPFPDKNMPELTAYIAKMALPINAYSLKWMSSPLSMTSFSKMIVNVWGTENMAPPVAGATFVQQTWCPEKMNIRTGIYSVYWRLVDQTYYNSEDTPVSGLDNLDSIPFSSDSGVLKIETSLRAILKKRIRRYRIRAAFYEMRVNQLSKRYYDRYGITEQTDNDSVLSLDTDDSE